MMDSASYQKRRGEIETYFDRTAIDAWKRLTSTAKVSGIRATVRAGRDEMRREILSRFPQTLTGWRILDAGCGGGMLAHDLASRGADVLGVDLSGQMIAHARDGLPPVVGKGRLSLMSGDMLSPDHGTFDAVVAMDSLIHYGETDMIRAVRGLAARCRRKAVFTLAPRTRLLGLMHMTGKAFPRSDRSPAIEPVRIDRAMRTFLEAPDMAGWQRQPGHRVARGFYISELQEIAHP